MWRLSISSLQLGNRDQPENTESRGSHGSVIIHWRQNRVTSDTPNSLQDRKKRWELDEQKDDVVKTPNGSRFGLVSK